MRQSIVKNTSLRTPSIRKNRPKIRRGVDLDELMVSCLMKEIRDYCRAHGIHLGGRKKELALKIIAYHSDNDEKGYVSKKRAQRNRRRAVLRRSTGFVPFRHKT